MNALIDTNVLIAAMLDPGADRPQATIVRAGLVGRFTMIVSEGTFTEIRESVATKRSLMRRISVAQAESYLTDLREKAIIIAAVGPDGIHLSRDSDDDYLLAHAIREQIDVLVSDDRHLLRMNKSMPFDILSTRVFLRLLAEQ
jgi:putative PIN family toxin of toxin-antitoxin system